MLNYIVKDEYFKYCLREIKKAYFPSEKYQAEFMKQGPKVLSPEEFNSILKEVVKKIAVESERYSVFSDVTPIVTFGKPLPFLDRFHEYFLQRNWNIPQPVIQYAANNLSRLYPDQQAVNPTETNFSKNCRDYNHFLNVIAALARLISYFQTPDRVQSLLTRVKSQTGRESSEGETCTDNFVSYENLAYGEDIPNFRTFRLMLAAFYHDIGKTVIYPRHGMEGRLILGFHTSDSPHKIDDIVRKYSKDDKPYKFVKEDLLFIGHLLNFHDLYGTISTGEDGYQQLVDIIDRSKRYSLIWLERENSAEEIENLKIWSQRNLFDLWLLNVADIMVSLKDKWQLQNGGINDWGGDSDNQIPGDQTTQDINWWEKDPAEKHIKAFFRLEGFDAQNSLAGFEKGSVLIHDLKISFRLLAEHNQKFHTDDFSRLQELALSDSRRHTVERLRRLLTESLRQALKPDNTKDKSNEDEKIRNLKDKLSDLSKSSLNSSIVRSIKSMGDFQEFCQQLACIGKMDYSLTFFQKIASRALEKVCGEIRGDNERTGWITDSQDSDYKTDTEYYKMQAQSFADNYAVIVVEILSYLLLRKNFAKEVVNLEFNDAKERLTDEKIDKIIALEGPFRTRRSIELILQTISMY